MKTRLCNFYHLIYQNWGSDRGIHSFSLFCSKIDCGYTHNLFLSQKTNKETKLSQFNVKIVIFTVVKIQDLLLGRVNVMQSIFKPLLSETDEANRCESFP